MYNRIMNYITIPGAGGDHNFPAWVKNLIVFNHLLIVMNSSLNFAIYCKDLVFRECVIKIYNAFFKQRSCNPGFSSGGSLNLVTRRSRVQENNNDQTQAVDMPPQTPSSSSNYATTKLLNGDNNISDNKIIDSENKISDSDNKIINSDNKLSGENDSAVGDNKLIAERRQTDCECKSESDNKYDGENKNGNDNKLESENKNFCDSENKSNVMLLSVGEGGSSLLVSQSDVNNGTYTGQTNAEFV